MIALKVKYQQLSLLTREKELQWGTLSAEAKQLSSQLDDINSQLTLLNNNISNAAKVLDASYSSSSGIDPVFAHNTRVFIDSELEKKLTIVQQYQIVSKKFKQIDSQVKNLKLGLKGLEDKKISVLSDLNNKKVKLMEQDNIELWLGHHLTQGVR